MRVANKSFLGSLGSLTAILTVAAMVLVSCRNEEPEGMKVTLYPVVMSHVGNVIETRALVADDYSKLSTVGTTIEANAVAFKVVGNTRVSTEDKNGIFTRSADRWTSNLEVTETENQDDNFQYNIYTYSPSRTSFPAHEVVFDYNEGTPKLTFTDLAVITGADPLVGIAAAGGEANSDPAPELNKGSYSTGPVKIINAESYEKRTAVWLAMDHLYAKATLSFKVDDEYNAIRTIKLKGAAVSIATGKLAGTSTYTYAKGTDADVIVWSDAAAYTGDAVSVQLVGEGATNAVNYDEDTNVITLTTSTKEVSWFCFLPRFKPVITLTVTYDVYDKEGGMVRENQVVTNNNLLRNVAWTGESVVGNNYKITVKVNPTYLYQLSDGDANLEIVIE